MTRSTGLPSFQASPLTEMAIGLQFVPFQNYNSLIAYQVWELFNEEYPVTQEYPATAPNFEVFGPIRHPIGFNHIQSPLATRFLFISAAGDDVVQFQNGKLFHNWRKNDHLGATHQYPRFEPCFAKLQEETQKLDAFSQANYGSSLSVNQAEVTYVSHIDISSNRDPSFWLRYITPGAGEVEDFIANFRRVLYGTDSKPAARFICEAGSATDPHGRPLIILTLTIRGAPRGTSVSQGLEFLQKNRETLVSAFAELTTESAHEVWGRTQ